MVKRETGYIYQSGALTSGSKSDNEDAGSQTVEIYKFKSSQFPPK
jgi:hypothetical protein